MNVDPEATYLLTPGPLTTSLTTKQAMLRDWGSRDGEFLEMTQRVSERLVELAGAAQTHVCVLLQGSGTFAVEAAIGSFVPRNGKLLVLVNGAYGRRMAKICEAIGRSHAIFETAEDTPPKAAEVGERLNSDAAITHVAMVHCETTSGILNSVHEIAQVVAQCGRRFLIDAMSSFGALELDARTTPFDVLVASGNKCLEGVPGLAFAIARTEALECCAGNAPSLSLDLYDQWQTMERTGQWRFTPPTHVTAALHQALREHAAEGGIAARGARYRRNCRILVNGMRALGFTTYLPDALQAPIIVTFHLPIDPKFQFETFYDHMQRRGFVLYPGKLTSVPSFRMGCIGRISETEIRLALAAVSEVLKELGVAQCGPQYGPMRAAASGG